MSKQKAAILAKVSTLKQEQEKEGLPLKNIQLPQLQKYAQDNSFKVVKELLRLDYDREVHFISLGFFMARRMG